MLKPSGCKPGVEIIAIKNYPYMKPALDIGAIYTIQEFRKAKLTFICDFGKLVVGPFIYVNEIESRVCLKCNEHIVPPYCLDQFKLRDVKQLEDLFDLKKEEILEPV